MVAKRSRYDNEFKRHAIEMYRCSNLSAVKVAEDLGIKHKTLQNWIAQSKMDEKGEIVTDSDITRLRKELANVREERDILKKAIAIFYKQSNKNTGL